LEKYFPVEIQGCKMRLAIIFLFETIKWSLKPLCNSEQKEVNFPIFSVLHFNIVFSQTNKEEKQLK
jgi:hypothetical protein